MPCITETELVTSDNTNSISEQLSWYFIPRINTNENKIKSLAAWIASTNSLSTNCKYNEISIADIFKPTAFDHPVTLMLLHSQYIKSD